MQRRDFIRTTGAFVAGASLAPQALEGAVSAAAAPGRIVLPINRGWRYSPKPIVGGHERGFDDSALERVVVPHTNKRLPWHGFDEHESYFVSLYRRRFRLPAAARGQRVFVDFEGAMTAATVWINGVRLGEYRGGYTPFSFELTPHVDWDGENVLAVDLDSTERPDIPPFGGDIDYLTFGGIYREVALRIVPATFIENAFVRTRDVLSGKPAVDVQCFLEGAAVGEPLTLQVELLDGNRTLARARQHVVASALAAATGAEPASYLLQLSGLSGIRLWDLEHPNLYQVRVQLLRGGQVVDEDTRRFGYRTAQFTEHGFELNGKVVKLRGLNRHQTFPFVGQAMPARVQRGDAEILRRQLHCNVVRTSHYPQSPHFLDACDELGLLVFEEIPGWQHVGDEAWKQLAIDNVRRMIRRDWNHPAIVLWGVRINESQDDHGLYVRTNALAHQLDATRQTAGVRYIYESELLEDVFTMNDFGFPLRPPNHPRYLNTEFIGHTYPTKTIDNVERLEEHTLRHARVHDQLASDARYAGGLGWCAFDYNTHRNFGSGDRICYHGVMDIFREPKPAAGFYRSQCDPAEELVLAPAFHWARGDQSTAFTHAVVCSNCDHLKFWVGDRLLTEADPDRKQFPHLPHPPFVVEFPEQWFAWADLRLEGYIAGKKVAEKRMSGAGVDVRFTIAADDHALQADGADATRVVLRVTDEFGAIRPFADAAIRLALEGPADIVGDNPFALVGGTGAVWIRAREQAGTVRLQATHPSLGTQELQIEVSAAAPEIA